MDANHTWTCSDSIDKGMKNGQKITFAGEGDQLPDIIPGDIIIVCKSSLPIHI